MDKEENILLAKWLNYTITPEELKRLEQEVDLVVLKETLDRQKEFDLEVKDTEIMWNEFQEKTGINDKPERKINTKKRLLIVLSIFVIGIIGYFIFESLTGPTEIKTKPQERERKELAGGSNIQLSPGSKVLYHENNWKKERKIELEGQAFFEVSKGVPFSVKTTVGLVEVLGTSFDIWSVGEYMKVQCFEGEVSVTEPKSGKMVNLTKGKQVNLNKGGLGTVENFDGSNPGWIEKNQQIYKSIPVVLVIKDIERFMGVKVTTSQVNIEAQLSGLIPFTNPEETARYLAESMGWKYVVNENDIQFSN